MPGYLHPLPRYEEFLRGLVTDPRRLSLSAWMFPREPLRIGEFDGELYVGSPCADDGTSAVGASIRMQALLDEFRYTSTLSQCEEYPDPGVIRDLTRSVREMLYCE